MKRNWYNCELEEPDTSIIKEKLKSQSIIFETSSAGFGYTHFEIFCTITEAESLDNFINNLPEGR